MAERPERPRNHKKKLKNQNNNQSLELQSKNQKIQELQNELESKNTQIESLLKKKYIYYKTMRSKRVCHYLNLF